MNLRTISITTIFLMALLFLPTWQSDCMAQNDLVYKTKSSYQKLISSIDKFIRSQAKSIGAENFIRNYYTRDRMELSLWAILILFTVIILIQFLAGKLRDMSGKYKTRSSKGLQKEAKVLSKKGMHLQAGDIYKDLQMYKQAIEQYKEAKAFSRQADVYKLQKEWDLAAQMYEKAGNFSNAADIYFKAKRYEKAEQMYLKDNRETLVAEMYEKVGIYQKAGVAYKNSGYFDKAADMFSKAGDHKNAAVMFHQAFMDQGGTKAGATGETISPRLRELVKKAGEHYILDNNLEKAADSFAKGGLFEKSAEVYIKLKDFNKAAVYFQKSENPEKAAAFFEKIGEKELASKFKAEALLRSGDAESAAEHFARTKDYGQAADLYVRVESWEKAAEMYQNSGDYDSAAEMFIRAEKLEKAADVYEKADQLANAAFMYERIGDFKKQAVILFKLKEYYKAGNILMEKGFFDDALKVLQQVPFESPDYFESCVLIGNVFLFRKMIPLALKKFQEAIKGEAVNIRNITPYYFLALIYEGAGQTDDALKIYHDILAIDFNFRDVQSRIDALRDSGVMASVMSSDTIIKTPPERLESIKIPETVVPILDSTASSSESSGPLTFSTSTNANGQTVVYQAPSGSSKPAKPRYVMIDELGRGGMGIVYKARDTVLKRDVAFKVLSTNLKDDEWALESFFREARAAAALNHPNVIHVYDASTDESNVFIVMEFVEGIDLKDLMKKKGVLKPAALSAIFRQVCAGLAYAHDHEVIHRDIKPSNIMLTQGKQVKIADFGLAKVLSEIKDSQSMISGTPYYMSPEQITGSSVDLRTDIYSLGVTLYELATGIVPFPSGEVNYHHVNTPPPDPKNSNQEIPDKLREIILKCLEKEPDLRYQTMHELSKDLKKVN